MGLFNRRSAPTSRDDEGIGAGYGARPEDPLKSEWLDVLPASFEAVGEAQAAQNPERVIEACWVVGRSLAEKGTSLGESIEGLRATTRLVTTRDPSFEEMQALSVAWSEATLAYVHGLSCSDPMTGLATVAHLRERVAGLYRDRFATPREQAFVVLEMGMPAELDPLGAAQRMTYIGQTARTVFSGQEPIARAGISRVVVMARRDEQLPQRVALLRRMLDHRITRAWIEGLPESEKSAARLLDELSRV